MKKVARILIFQRVVHKIRLQTKTHHDTKISIESKINFDFLYPPYLTRLLRGDKKSGDNRCKTSHL